MKPMSAATREKHRQASLRLLDCPIRRAIIGKKVAASWRDPSIRARRIAAAKATWANPEIRARRVKALLSANQRPRDRSGRFVAVAT